MVAPDVVQKRRTSTCLEKVPPFGAINSGGGVEKRHSTTSSSRYTGQFTLSGKGTKTVRGIAVKSGYVDSAVATATFTIN